MSTSTMIQRLVYIPQNVRKNIVISQDTGESDWKLPDFDMERLAWLTLDMGTLYGYPMSEFLQQYTAPEEFSTQWDFGRDTAQNLIETIVHVLDGNEREEWLPDEIDEEFYRDLDSLREWVEKALEENASDFQVSIWY